jgi:hypothetical protein
MSDRDPVTDDQYYGRAVAVLLVFNLIAGTHFGSRNWIAKILVAIRAHPELTLADHVSVIETVFARPWWKGEPSPSVVYGGKAFESALRKWRAAGCPDFLEPEPAA